MPVALPGFAWIALQPSATALPAVCLALGLILEGGGDAHPSTDAPRYRLTR